MIRSRLPLCCEAGVSLDADVAQRFFPVLVHAVMMRKDAANVLFEAFFLRHACL